MLAWRLYVVYGGRSRWALYLPAAAVVVTARKPYRPQVTL